MQQPTERVSEQKGERFNLSTRQTELNVSTRPPGIEADIKQLVVEFKELYEHKLKCLEMDTNASKEESLQKKMDFLQSYVDDLTDQNQVLVQTIEELQRNAGHKVSNFGMKRYTSNVSGVDLRTLQLDDLIGPAVQTPPSFLVQDAYESEELRIQLQTKDLVISDLERELAKSLQQKQKSAVQVLESSEKLVRLQTELSCLQRIHKDNTKEIAGKDVCITKLQATVQLLQQEGTDAGMQLSELNIRTKELQEELKKKEEKWRQIEVEQKMKDEKKRRKAEERRRQEQETREEWMKRLGEEKRREEEWRKQTEEEKKAYTEAIKKWAEKAAILNSELEVSRKQVERQNQQLSEFHLEEETLLSEAEAKMVRLKDEFTTLLETRTEEKEARINQVTQELNGFRQKMKEKEDRVRHLNQDVVALRATEDSLKRTLAMKEKHTQQLVQYNAELKDSLATLHSKLQTSEAMLADVNGILDQTRTSLHTDRQERQRIQDQLHHAGEEAGRLQLELTHVRRTAEKKIQKRETKMCALATELAQSKKQHADCQKELLQTDEVLERLREEMKELRAKLEDQSRECVHLNQTKERLQADLAVSHHKLHTSHLEVRSRDQLILQLRAEMKTAEQKQQDTQKQVATLEGEVRHLNREVRGHQEAACQINEKVRDIDRLKDQKEKEQQHLHNQLHVCQQQVQRFEEKLKRKEDEMEHLLQQVKEANDEQKEARLQTQEQKETAAIFQQKYSAAVEKIRRLQGQLDLLQEELRYSKQQLQESHAATDSVTEELTDLERRYKEKVGQWETSQEALDQLTDDLQANQTLLRESHQKVEHFRSLMGCLQEQTDTLEQQKLMLECDLQLYQQSHSHSDGEYLSLFRLVPQLQERCAEQLDRLAEGEKAILQMKSELQRQTKENQDLKQSLSASHHEHLSHCSQLEQQVTRLKKTATRLENELAENQKVEVTLFRQSEEDLKEARREAARRSREVDVQRGEVQKLQEELQREEKKTKSAVREKQRLSDYTRQLNEQLEDQRRAHQVTVEELAARAEEARRMEGCLNEGKLAEEKIRSIATRVETEVTELRRNLQQAVDQTLEAEKEKQDAQEQVNTVRSELQVTRSDNARLRHESQQVMTNVNLWITEQKAYNESLAAQMKAQSKVLLIITDEKERLQEANDALKADVKALREVVDVKERDMEHFKTEMGARGIWQDGRIKEKKGCAALNLSKIEDLQTRLQSNLEAIGMLNQQLNVLSGENQRLRRQLEEERSMRRKEERRLPPPCSSIRLPLSLHACPPRPPPPHPAASFPSSLRLLRPPSPALATGDADQIPDQSELSAGGLASPGESRAVGGAFRTGPRGERSLVWEDEPASGQMRAPEDFDLS